MHMDSFTVINENYEFKDGEILLVFKISDSSKDYVLYSIDNNNGVNCSLVIGYIEKDEKGFDELKDIPEIEERKKVIEVIKNILKGDANNEWF